MAQRRFRYPSPKIGTGQSLALPWPRTSRRTVNTWAKSPRASPILSSAEGTMERRDFLKSASLGFATAGHPLGNQAAVGSDRGAKSEENPQLGYLDPHDRPKDYRKEPFKRLVILGESTVEGGGWLHQQEDRYGDVLARLINACQKEPIEYHNKGIGANAISPRSPGYAQSRKPSALERYHQDVIDLQP